MSSHLKSMFGSPVAMLVSVLLGAACGPPGETSQADGTGSMDAARAMDGAIPTTPTVMSSTPASGATSVAINANATATFSEAMNPADLTATTFTLTSGATPITGTVTYA